MYKCVKITKHLEQIWGKNPGFSAHPLCSNVQRGVHKVVSPLVAGFKVAFIVALVLETFSRKAQKI